MHIDPRRLRHAGLRASRHRGDVVRALHRPRPLRAARHRHQSHHGIGQCGVRRDLRFHRARLCTPCATLSVRDYRMGRSCRCIVFRGGRSRFWFHRTAHRVRWFWAEHVAHHSSQHYNLSTALRQPWTGFCHLPFCSSFRCFSGFPVGMLAFVGGINLVYQFWIHTEAVGKLPRWFEAVMNTPSHHRVHHATNAEYLDANYAGVFIVWDRLFGTFVEEDARETALRHREESGHLQSLKVAFHEFIALARDVARGKITPRMFALYLSLRRAGRRLRQPRYQRDDQGALGRISQLHNHPPNKAARRFRRCRAPAFIRGLNMRILLAALPAPLPCLSGRAIAHMATPLATIGLRQMTERARRNGGMTSANVGDQDGLFIFPWTDPTIPR